MRRVPALRSTLLVWAAVLAAVLAAGCRQESAPPLREGALPSKSAAPSPTPSPTAAFDPSVLACEVGQIMSAATAAAAQHTTDRRALAGIYRDAARKIRAVAARAAGTPVGRAIGNAAAAVDRLAGSFAGSGQPLGDKELTAAFDALPVCEGD